MVRLGRERGGVVAGVVALAVDGRLREGRTGGRSPASVTGSNGQITIPDGSPLRSALSFDTARTVTLSDVVTATAAVESDPARTVKLFPPMAGRVVALNVHLGDPVRKGEPLVTLDSPDFTSAQADYAHALTAYRQAKNNLTRERDLAQYGIAAQRDVEQAETDFSQADGDRQRAAVAAHRAGARHECRAQGSGAGDPVADRRAASSTSPWGRVSSTTIPPCPS